MSDNANNKTDKKLRVILLTHGGAELVLEKLLALENVIVVGVFVETDVVLKRSLKEKIKRSIRYDGYVSTAKKFARTVFNRNSNEEVKEAKNGQSKFSETAQSFGVPLYFVGNYHAEESIRLMKTANADLGIIYGTNIVKETVFAIPRLGSINLHQGFAPIYRGGPAIFWELFNGEKEIGLTVHYVAAKVDTGDIIIQNRLPLVYDFKHGAKFENFISEYSRNLKEPSAQIVTEAVRLIAENKAQRQPQNTSKGKRYRLPTKKEKDELRRLLRNLSKK